MKTPEEIKKGLEVCSLPSDTSINKCFFCPYKNMPNCSENMNADALAYTKQLEAQVPKWISVEEWLPETGDVVLVIANGKPREHITLINAFLIASYWGEEGWIADGFEGWDKLDVSYWMELPRGPEEET